VLELIAAGIPTTAICQQGRCLNRSSTCLVVQWLPVRSVKFAPCELGRSVLS
jgi:hypothetical protein